MKHWIRDAQITFATATSGLGQISYLLFHFLRTAGWTWLWECDGYAGDTPNRIPDGNMETVGVGSWTALGGATLSKVTTPVHSGVQALKVISSGGSSVESSNFVSTENLKTYHVAIWALNNTGQPWDVQVDTGTGYVSVGSIPPGALYTLSHFSFTSAAAGNRKIKIVDNMMTSGTIYVSDILVVKSYFEYNPTDIWVGGTDGSTINPDQFSSLSYSFVAGDIGKFVCVWDTTNPGNSGAYQITAAAGGVATVNMRSGSATFVAQGSLSWRMIDLADAPDNPAGADTGQRGAGFGLQSPHISGWRLFVRQCQYGSANYEITGTWAAPIDTDFDFSTGTFYKTGPSTQNSKEAAYAIWASGSGTWANMHYWAFGPDSAPRTQRFWLMTDNDSSFISMVMWDTSGSFYHDCPVIGYLGSSVYMPGEEAWGLFARWSQWSSSDSGMNWDSTNTRFAYSGTMIGPDGLAKDAMWGQLGFGSSTAAVVTQSNAGDNPWSGQEWVHKPIIIRDPEGNAQAPGEIVADIGIFQGRQNMISLSTFDSDNYLHFRNGFIWEWSGETILP